MMDGGTLTREGGYWAAAIFALFGIATVVCWEQFLGVDAYFARIRAYLDPTRRRRLSEARAAWHEAANLRRGAAYVLAATAFAGAAAVALFPVSIATAFGLLSAYLAAVVLAGYMQSRDASRPRTASLAKRRFTDAIPIPVAVASVVALLCVATFVAYPATRIGASLVTIAMLVTFGVAWRFATEPVKLRGDDPAVELAIDRRLRGSIPLSLIAFACIAGGLTPYFAYASLQPVAGIYAHSAGLVASLCYLVVASYQLVRQRSIRSFLSAFEAEAA